MKRKSYTRPCMEMLPCFLTNVMLDSPVGNLWDTWGEYENNGELF